jgi:tetratricopeptide (TPR) repeat protein
MSPRVFRDAQVLRGVILRAPSSAVSVPLLLANELRTDATNEERTNYLRAVQQFAPSDFWVNQRLGDVLMHTDKPLEAIGYYQVAVALRGDVAIARNNLAQSLLSAKRYEEAEQEYSKAVSLEPHLDFIRVGWIRVLHVLGRHKEVINQRALLVANHPTNAMFRMLLGMSLERQHDTEGAHQEFDTAILLQPNNAEIQREFRSFLFRQSRHEEAFEKWSRWAESSDHSHDAVYGLAELSLFLKHSEDYEVHRNALLDRFENSMDRYVVERVARTGLLAATSNSQLARILKMSESVTQLDRKTAGGTYPFFQFLKALTLFRQGKHDDAQLILEGDAVNVLRPVPQLIVSMIQVHRNDLDAAKSTYAEAEKTYDWTWNRALDQDAWIRHVFRREASELINTKAIATQPE